MIGKPDFPVIDKRLGLAQDLVFDMPFYEGGGGLFHDIASGMIGTESSAGDPTWVRTTRFGYAVKFTSGGNNRIIINDAARIQSIMNLTIQAIVRSDSSDAGSIVTKEPNPAGTNGPYWELRQDRSTNSWAAAFDWGNNPGWGSTNGSNPGDAFFHNIFMSIGRLDSSSATPDFMVDAVLKNTFAFSVAPTGSFIADGATMSIGNGDATGLNNGEAGVSIALIRIWARILSRKEKYYLSKHPWAIYKQPRLQPLNSVGGTAFTKSLNDSVTLNEFLKKATAKQISASVTLAETIKKATTKPISTSVTLAESLKKQTGKPINQTVTLVESLKRATVKTAITATVTLVESLTKSHGQFKSLSDSISLAEKLIKSPGKVLNEKINVFERANHALLFDGSDDYVAIEPATVFFSTSGISFGCKFIVPSVSNQSFGHVISVGGGDSAIIYYYAGGDSLSIKFSHTSIDQAFYNNPPKDVPLYVIATYDGTTCKVYVNGVLWSTINVSGTLGYDNNNFIIGAADGLWNGSFFTGVIDKPFAYNGILSGAQVTDIVNLQKYPASNMVVLWNMGEGSGTTLADFTGNGNTGTFGDTPTWVRGLTTLNKSTVKTILNSVSLVETLLRNIAKRFTTSITLNETFSKLYGKSFSNTITLTESLKRATSKLLTTSVSLTETLKKATTRLLVTSVSLTEFLQKKTSKTFSASVSLVEQLQKKTSKSYQNTITLVESFLKKTNKTFSEHVTLTEFFTKRGTFFRSFSESVTLHEKLSKQTSKTFSTSVTLIDRIQKAIAKRFTERITIGEIFKKTADLSHGYVRTATQYLRGRKDPTRLSEKHGAQSMTFEKGEGVIDFKKEGTTLRMKKDSVE